MVLGNYIGTNASGDDLGNDVGIGIYNSASSNTIGGTGNAANTIGFNLDDGIDIAGSGATGNMVLGNYIGTNASGANLGNGGGIAISEASNNTIGGAGNSANTIGFNSDGIDIESGATGNMVLGNYIGTNASGDKLGNSEGVVIEYSASNNTIGGAGNAANTIGFSSDGIDITGSGATGNVVLGNYIGSNASGDNLGNGDVGVLISDAPSNTIGGANTIGYNGTGIDITGSGATGNVVQGNFIGTDTEQEIRASCERLERATRGIGDPRVSFQVHF